MARSFHYVVPFGVIETYIVGVGYKPEPIYNSGMLQYYAVGTTQVGVAPENPVRHPVTGDLLTHLRASIFINHQFDHQNSRHTYDAESLGLYRKLYRRFAEQ